MTTRVLLFLGLVLVALGVAWVLVPPVPTGGLGRGAPAPDFAATDLDGRPVRLRDLRGNVVVLDFWATWCGPCVAMIPEERDLVDRFQDRPFKFIGVSADDSPDVVRPFVKRQRMEWTHVFDGPNGPIGQLYDVNAYPTLYVIDAAGMIRFQAVGGHEARRVEGVVAQLLDELH